MDIHERRAAVLRAIVEEYVVTAQPVGSQTIACSRGLGVSSATVRNDMTVLEREGYLAQPHTSAGRVPTDRGYRYYVDHFGEPGSLAPSQRRAVLDFFTSAHHALEDLLHETSRLLAGITRHAAVVMGPHPDIVDVRSLQLVRLHPTMVVAVAVLSNGAVETANLHLEVEMSEADLDAAASALSNSLVGADLARLPAVPSTGSGDADRLVGLVRDTFASRAASSVPDALYVGGASRLASESAAFPTSATALRLLEMLEHQVVVVSLVRKLLDDGVTVSIGAENEVEELRDCSLIIAPYTIEGEAAGTVGVLGPTRMDYRQALAAVAAVSLQLGRALS
ncbi:MAG: heat-inducible transcriptional repressor HrcA [Acidimicrobiia bacterium]